MTEIAGGVANNVIPDRVTRGLNYRYGGHQSPAQAEARLRELVGTTGNLRIESSAPAAPTALENPLVQRLRSAGGLAVEPKPGRRASDDRYPNDPASLSVQLRAAGAAPAPARDPEELL